MFSYVFFIWSDFFLGLDQQFSRGWSSYLLYIKPEDSAVAKPLLADSCFFPSEDELGILIHELTVFFEGTIQPFIAMYLIIVWLPSGELTVCEPENAHL